MLVRGETFSQLGTLPRSTHGRRLTPCLNCTTQNHAAMTKLPLQVNRFSLAATLNAVLSSLPVEIHSALQGELKHTFRLLVSNAYGC